jgi:pimeloyl-ACP methyl ester carboxylesterase
VEQADVDGVELAYELHGEGPPVVLVHWGVDVGWAEPLLCTPPLSDRYRLPSGRLRGERPRHRAADHGRPRAPLLPAHALRLDRARARRRPLLQRIGRAPAGPRRLDADAFFGQELPALQQWSFTEEDAARVTQPVLGVLGEHTEPTFPERLKLLLSWLPNAERFELPNATHLLHIQNPRGMSEALDAFYGRQ